MNDNTQKDPKDWVSGDDPMTGAQASYLKTLAEQQPTTMDALRGIPGMGPKKLADYGDAVLKAIAEE